MRPDVRGRPPEVSAIVPRLFIGEYPRPKDVEPLRREHGISAVLSLQDDHDLFDKGLALDRLEEAYARAAIEFRRVPIADMSESEIESRLAGAVAELDRLIAGGHTVLLHCNAGMNRAPTVAIAYLCAHHAMALGEAWRCVKERRASCLPFMTPLRARFR